MAETTLTPEEIINGTRTPGAIPTVAGYDYATALTAGAANEDGSCYTPAPGLFLVFSGSGAASVVTITRVVPNDDGFSENLVMNVGIGQGRMIPAPGVKFAAVADGKVHMTWTNYAGLKVLLLKLPS